MCVCVLTLTISVGILKNIPQICDVMSLYCSIFIHECNVNIFTSLVKIWGYESNGRLFSSVVNMNITGDCDLSVVKLT